MQFYSSTPFPANSRRRCRHKRILNCRQVLLWELHLSPCNTCHEFIIIRIRITRNRNFRDARALLLTCFGRRRGFEDRDISWRAQWRWSLQPDPFRRGRGFSSCGSSPAAAPQGPCWWWWRWRWPSHSTASISNSEAMKVAPLNSVSLSTLRFAVHSLSQLHLLLCCD